LKPAIKIPGDIEANGFSVCDNLFSLSETDVFLSEIKKSETQKLFRQASIGNAELKQLNPEIRTDHIIWLNNTEESVYSLFFDRVNELMLNLNRRFYLGLNDYEFHMAHYPAGAFYKKHKDAFKNDDARRITVILYLNKNWVKGNGGELKLYLENRTETIAPTAGRLLVFESHLEHEVLESKADRYSITGWLKNKSRLF